MLTITGTGLGPDLLVTVDGQPAPQLPGASDTQVEVLAPATVMSTPGTYRLTVVDNVRHVGDGFVVASPRGSVMTASSPEPDRSGGDLAATGATPREGVRGTAPHDRAAPRSSGVSPKVIEGPTNTAVGQYALDLNISGTNNTATGVNALYWNWSGYGNTASGMNALFSNTHGFYNTASGVAALYANTTGLYNTATGREALRNTTTGSFNVATGADALHANVTGSDNAATGVSALQGSTASFNTAHGTNALLNTTTGGSNVGVGSKAGASATTGSYNVYLGADVLGTASDANTMRLGLPYSGGVGQNRTFIAGIHGTQLTGSYLPVVVDTNGQLGTLIPAVVTGGPATLVTPAAVEQQLQEQRAINAAQQAMIEDLLARLVRLEAASRRASRP